MVKKTDKIELKKKRKKREIKLWTSYNEVRDSRVRALLELKRMELERSN